MNSPERPIALSHPTGSFASLGSLPLRAWVLLLLGMFCGGNLLADDRMTGDWSLQLASKTPAWLSIKQANGKPVVRMRLYVGPEGPYDSVKESNGRLRFNLKGNKNLQRHVDVEFDEGRLQGFVVSQTADGNVDRDPFVGQRIPTMPSQPPDLEKVRFGHPISLFNGRDMSGWRPHEPDKINGWSVQDGTLVNTTPKTDFSATGAYANLRTESVFEDFWLHIEFLVGEGRNSGVYLRGMYEAQVVDRDSRMQGIQGVGAIFGKIAPTANAGRVGGQWQTYDLTLVDRHITVVLNGVKVIDNQPIEGPTGGAILTNPMEPGPIYLQGDHTAVAYRNIYLAPVIRD